MQIQEELRKMHRKAEAGDDDDDDHGGVSGGAWFRDGPAPVDRVNTVAAVAGDDDDERGELSDDNDVLTGAARSGDVEKKPKSKKCGIGLTFR